MRLGYILDDLLPLAGIAIGGWLLIYGLGQLIFTDMEKSHDRYDLCIASGNQWISGNCVK